MDWLWKRVCSPNCTNACKTYCPGCRARADEWAAEEEHAPPPAPREPRFAKTRELARCAVDCLRAETRGLLRRRKDSGPELLQIGESPRRLEDATSAGETPPEHACGCETAAPQHTDRPASGASR